MITDRILLPVCLAALSSTTVRTNAATNLVNNGSFETPSMPIGSHYHVPVGSLGLGTWQTISSPSFEIWSNPTPGSLAFDGTQHLELQDAPDAVFQTIPTVAGQQYSLIFYHSPRPTFDTMLTVSLNSTAIVSLTELGSAISSFSWKEYSATFVADSAFTTLSFSDATTVPGNGSHIDFVQVYAIPEPSSIAACALALMCLLGRRIRRS